MRRGTFNGSMFGPNDQITPHFKYGEFKCKCCGTNFTKREFIEKLETARVHSNTIDSKVSYNIISGYRCPEHNEYVGGVKDSAHTTGIACDIQFKNNHDKFVILYGVFKAGFKRIGEGNGFIHVDTDTNKPQYTKWGYEDNA